ncbi:MAG: methyltransferase domain-containing protein [Holosporales bacterium]|jgi:malonyl-ACP O-methyltransferase BioC|nr:methyltransferase domain-containing protein [Holosporales bacterium]
MAHGLGFSDEYWENLIKKLPGEFIFYREGLLLNKNKHYVGIGHSLGFQKLNNSGIKFDLLFGLQGFLNFCGTDERLKEIRKKNLDKMIKMFQADWQNALESFYQSCDYPGNIPNNISKEDLVRDFELLKTDNKHCGAKTVIIGSYDDRIVPPILIEDNFACLNNVLIKYVDKAGHSLGFNMSEVIANIIQEEIFKFQISGNFNAVADEYDKYAKIQKQSSNRLAKMAWQSIGNFEVKSILDIGAGIGQTTEEFMAYYPRAEYTLLDISDNMLKKAKEKIKNIKIITADAENYKFNQEYDLCIANLSVQWFVNFEEFLKKIKKGCKYLAFSTLLDSSFKQYKHIFKQKNTEPPTFKYSDELKLLKIAEEYGQIIQKDIFSYKETFPNAVLAAKQFKRIGANQSSHLNNKIVSVLLSRKSKIELEYDIFFAVLIAS